MTNINTPVVNIYSKIFIHVFVPYICVTSAILFVTKYIFCMLSLKHIDKDDIAFNIQSLYNVKKVKKRRINFKNNTFNSIDN